MYYSLEHGLVSGRLVFISFFGGGTLIGLLNNVLRHLYSEKVINSNYFLKANNTRMRKGVKPKSMKHK